MELVEFWSDEDGKTNIVPFYKTGSCYDLVPRHHKICSASGIVIKDRGMVQISAPGRWKISGEITLLCKVQAPVPQAYRYLGGSHRRRYLIPFAEEPGEDNARRWKAQLAQEVVLTDLDFIYHELEFPLENVIDFSFSGRYELMR